MLRYKFVIFFLYLVVLFYFGFNPKGFSYKNTIKTNDHGELLFSKGSLAFIDIYDKSVTHNMSYDSLLIEFVLKPSSTSLQSKNIIRLEHSSGIVNDMYAFQWNNKIIFSFGEDYSNKKKLPRVSADLLPNNQRVKILVFNELIELYVDDALVDVVSDQKIKWPISYPFRVKIGDFSSPSRGWEGAISFFYVGLSSSVSNKIKHLASYEFKNTDSISIGDTSTSSYWGDLVLPEYPAIYDRELLSFPLSFHITYSFIYDVFINIVGFVPFGFLLMKVVSRPLKLDLSSVIIVITVGFFISFFIEYVQSWMPGRDSSLLDLLLNTLGTFLGVIFFILI